MIRSIINRLFSRNRIRAAENRHEAIAALQAAIRRGDTRGQNQAAQKARQATIDALRMGV